ncbi:ABC transporter substrate-binding protein [Aureispira anguillae]|uniref:ABC transporter substrate-binding protein n=1 Tax=Aureispira anguillae TaxID=2864201 RepID=A0A915YC92_9BACT|nr:ABC transporter substrate-binding protein [Aureispira anguillae]BDS10424.1 ABC transporter substrate-binding protein [Aureispira anguillae]
MQYVIILLVALFCSPVLGQKEFTINVHEISDPDGLNPLTSKAANAENIEDNIFCRLLEFNRETFQLEPALALKRPLIETPKTGKYKGGMALTYEIHPAATWDNGMPVTGNDYLFTIKVVKHRNVESAGRRLSLEFIDDVVVDAANPKKFTIYSKKVFFTAESLSGNLLHILPEYIYDPSQTMRSISIADLMDAKKEYSDALKEFADDFNSAKYASEIAFVKGCGPYQLAEWDAGGSITLERKKDWWGDKVADNLYLKAYPTKIVYHIMPGMGWVLSKMRDGELDIVRNVPPQRFYDAQKKEEYTKLVDFHEPSQFAYHYLALNAQSPKLSDKRVREAIACAVNRERIVQEFFGGAAMKVNTPISPHRTYYDIKEKGTDFDLKKAQSLLTKAGWKDTDGDDVLDKRIDGKLVKLRLKYNYNKGNLVRKAIGEMLKEDLAQIGIKMDLYPIDFATLLANANARNYEVIALAWVNTPGSDDLKNVWHTSADTKNGGNRVGFGTPKTDRIIDEISVTLDENKRKELYLEIQQLIVAEHPYVFLVVPNQLIMIKKGFTYPDLGPVRPGYVTRLFQKK